MTTFQQMIAQLQAFWEAEGCAIMQPYHTELGAGTSNPATLLRVLGPRPWRTAYVEPSIRPDDGRYGENPYRFQQHYQYQVILKPAPDHVCSIHIPGHGRQRWAVRILGSNVQLLFQLG